MTTALFLMMVMAMTQAQTVSEILQAKYSGNSARVDELLKTGMPLNIFEAAATGQTARVRELLAADPALVNTYAPDGFFPLALAVFFGNTAAAEALLDAGADVNQQSRESMKIRALQSAAAAKRIDLAEMLLARGANPNLPGGGGFVPLHGAASSGQIDLALLLLKHGADVNAKDDPGKTPLAHAINGQKEEMMAFLRQRGAV
jgi:ankyrin repeat protein